MSRRTAAGKAAAGPSNTSDSNIVAVLTSQKELAIANAEIKRLKALFIVRNTLAPCNSLTDAKRLAAVFKTLF